MSSKFNKRIAIPILLTLFLSTVVYTRLYAGDTIRPMVIKSWKAYRSQALKDPVARMVELKSRIPNIVYDLRYATENNFVGKRMYPANTTKTFLRQPAAEALALVQADLNRLGLGVKIFDAYRPFSVTEEFWELIRDERYVANPAKGSNHNRGIAVDLTIIDLKTGNELDMGTGFDNFTDSAHHSFAGFSEEILQNRLLLKSTMEKYGFRPLTTEWWHYYFGEPARFPLLDLSFRKLQKPV
ncbi:MAG TPA: M15 family metallopeptidase [Chitinophagaceae bacterium]|nr:M15 family metallopeptidase [Chitinophagaceae bacterium]